jgi:hypothetical protein
MGPESDGVMAPGRCVRGGIAVGDHEPVTFPIERGSGASHGLVNTKVVVTGICISKVEDQGKNAQRYYNLESNTCLTVK